MSEVTTIPQIIKRFTLNFRYAFQIRKPILIYRLIKVYLGIFLGKRPFRYLDFAIDYSCNLKCEHCFATALIDPSRPSITPEDFGKVVTCAMKLGAVNFSFQGGEPTIFPSLSEYIKASSPKRNLISVTTNATVLDEKEIIKLKKLGVDILTVSLDSGIPQEHDRFRGASGTFDKALSAIIIAIDNGLKVTIGATISHQNIRSPGITELIELAHCLNVILFFAPAVPLGRWSNRKDVLLTEDDKEYLTKLLKKYPLLRTDFDANYIHRGCGAVKEILYISPYGDVFPCPFLHFPLGNVKEQRLTDIREKALKQPFFKKYHNKCLAG